MSSFVDQLGACAEMEGWKEYKSNPYFPIIDAHYQVTTRFWSPALPAFKPMVGNGNTVVGGSPAKQPLITLSAVTLLISLGDTDLPPSSILPTIPC